VIEADSVTLHVIWGESGEDFGLTMSGRSWDETLSQDLPYLKIPSLCSCISYCTRLVIYTIYYAFKCLIAYLSLGGKVHHNNFLGFISFY
jgi:hypothetical protein